MQKQGSLFFSKITQLICALLIVYGFLVTVEQLLWANSNHYPAILVKDKLTGFSVDQLESMRKSCSEPLQINIANDGLYIRCGLVWPFASIWFISKNEVDKKILKVFYQYN